MSTPTPSPPPVPITRAVAEGLGYRVVDEDTWQALPEPDRDSVMAALLIA